MDSPRAKRILDVDQAQMQTTMEKHAMIFFEKGGAN